jgi:hypothetical protein
MRPSLPDKLGGQFCFLFSMTIVGFVGIVLAIAMGWKYQAAAGALICIIFGHRLVLHVRAVRLGKKLKLHPELAKLYYGRET